MTTAANYLAFASLEARGESPCYEEWATGVAADQQLLGLIDKLPDSKRQPNLLFAAARYAGIPPGSFTDFRADLLRSWPEVTKIILSKRTQTNEPGRCAALLPLLAALPQPLALLEVGASAGLCLYPDKFSYQYGGLPRIEPPAGSGTLLGCEIEGPVPVPAEVPQVVWRAGIDLHPLDVTDAEQMGWLKALIWPEQEARRQRLAAAIDIARSDPPHLVAGDLNETLGTLAAQAPCSATLVIFHSAVLAYLDAPARSAFTATIRDIPGHWLSNEAPSVIPFTNGSLPPPPDPDKALFVLAQDGEPVAYTAAHGQYLHWLN